MKYQVLQYQTKNETNELVLTKLLRPFIAIYK
jgi:hypothetical protein